jgi:hypothetical protein
MPGWTLLRPVCGTSLDIYVATSLTFGCSVRDIVSLLFTNEFSLGEACGTPLSSKGRTYASCRNRR